MGWGKAVLVLAVLQFIAALLPADLAAAAAAADPPSPLFTFDGICKNGSVDCGRGRCEASTKSSLGFACVCDPGWSQSESEFHVEDYLAFLPCVVPNCTINYSCTNESVFATAASPAPPPLTNISLLDPCSYSFCGGGSCVRLSTLEHRCECRNGFSNLLNITTFPCFNDCSLGADCSNLGISMTNTSTTTSSSSSPDEGNASSAAGGRSAPSSSLLPPPMLLLSAVYAFF